MDLFALRIQDPRLDSFESSFNDRAQYRHVCAFAHAAAQEGTYVTSEKNKFATQMRNSINAQMRAQPPDKTQKVQKASAKSAKKVPKKAQKANPLLVVPHTFSVLFPSSSTSAGDRV
jgi:uncharacterized lipoprotein